MRTRKAAKQLKRYYKEMVYEHGMDWPIIKYKPRQLLNCIHYLERTTRRNYFGLLKKYPKGTMMWQLYIHKSCSPSLFSDDIMPFWGYDELSGM